MFCREMANYKKKIIKTGCLLLLNPRKKIIACKNQIYQVKQRQRNYHEYGVLAEESKILFR